MTGRELSIKYGFTQKEFTELKRKGVFTEIKPRTYDENQIKAYYDEFWSKHITMNEIKKYGISNTKITNLIKDGKIKTLDKHYDRVVFMDYINGDEYKAYVDLKNKTIKHLENARKT